MSSSISRRSFTALVGGGLAAIGGAALGLVGWGAPRRAEASVLASPVQVVTYDDAVATPENPLVFPSPVTASFENVLLERGGYIELRGGGTVQIQQLVKTS
jgi:hypothetical protein